MNSTWRHLNMTVFAAPKKTQPARPHHPKEFRRRGRWVRDYHGYAIKISCEFSFPSYVLETPVLQGKYYITNSLQAPRGSCAFWLFLHPRSTHWQCNLVSIYAGCEAVPFPPPNPENSRVQLNSGDYTRYYTFNFQGIYFRNELSRVQWTTAETYKLYVQS